MSDRQSQMRRERDRKPDDTHGHHLRREEGQAPSTGRNAGRMEQWIGGRKKGMGRRGKKKQQQEKRVGKQRRTNAEERRDELMAREPLARRAKEKILYYEGFCKQGLVVSAWKESSRNYSPHMFTSEGLVLSKTKLNVSICVIGRPTHTSYTTVDTIKVQPWSEMSTRFLRMILKSAWKPYEPKSILDQIVVATGRS